MTYWNLEDLTKMFTEEEEFELDIEGLFLYSICAPQIHMFTT